MTSILLSEIRSIDTLKGNRQCWGKRKGVTRMRLAVRGVPKGALRTHSAEQVPRWGSLITWVARAFSFVSVCIY